ncbi:MAG: hypothetical protein AAF587_39480 [Bacteroidota bacterium]
MNPYFKALGSINASLYLGSFLILLSSLIPSCKPEEAVEPEVNHPPGVFTVSVSTDDNTADISWTRSIDPDGDQVSYTLIIDSNTLLESSSETSYEWTNLAYNSSHSGSVTAYDTEGLSKKVEVSFTIGDAPNEAPSAFSLTSPENEALFIDLKPNLTWTESTDPDSDPVVYDVLLDQQATPTTVIASDISETQLQVEELEEERTYYWKVIAKDGKGGESSSETFSFTTRSTVTATLETTAPWTGRSNHTALVFNNKLWVLGGNPCCGGRKNDVWSSEDGINWTEETASAAWAPRAVHTSVVFDGKMWVLGGNSSYSSGSEFSDVWYSEDGVNWTLAVDNAPFQGRYNHEMLVYDDKMWIIGGRDVNKSYSAKQIWNSSDGVNWTLINDNYGFGFANTGEVLEYDDKMWLIGGYNDNVRWSTDGITWAQVTNEAAFGEKINHASVVYDNRMWVISGSDNLLNELTETADVWYSTDGITWIQAAQNAGFVPVAAAEAVDFLGKIWLIGGGGGWKSNFVTNEIYSFD